MGVIRTAPAGSSWPRLGDWSTFEELAALQAQAIGPSVATARGSPFYRKLLAQDARIADVPLTTKGDLRGGYPWDFLARPFSELVTYHESSGTTGRPIASFLTEADWRECVDRFNRGAVRMGPLDRVLVKTPYSMATTAHQMHNAALACRALVVPADNRSSMMSYPRVLRLLGQVGITVTWSLPTETLFWAAAAWASGAEPAVIGCELRALVVAGEILSPAKRQRIAQLWGARVVEDYGSTETCSLAGECEMGTLHAWADRFFFEVCDPVTGVMTPRGRGRLVVTTLYRQAMPLVRYDLGDVVDLRDEPCACGWVLPCIRVVGRALLARGEHADHVSQAVIDDLVYRLPIEYGVLFWRGLLNREGLRLEIEVDPRLAGDAVAELRVAAGDQLGIVCDVSAVPPGSLVPTEVLIRETSFAKPRFLFSSTEDWDQGLIYAE